MTSRRPGSLKNLKTSGGKTSSIPVPPSLTGLREAATRAAHASGRVLMKRFRTRLRVREKPGEGLVTNADLESERTAVAELRRAFPDFGILTEESSARQGRSPGRWILDPLDGTTNYAHGFPNFCVSIAAEWEGEVLVGVIHHPVLGETYTAIRGKGAFVNGQRMRVSSVSHLRDAMLTTGFSSRKEKWLGQEILAFRRLSRVAHAVRRPGSSALDLAQVARGVFDGFWERGLSAWDVAAGALMVQEAGGLVTDFKGGPLRLDSGELLCSNGSLHRAMLREAGLRSQIPSRSRAMGSRVRRQTVLERASAMHSRP